MPSASALITAVWRDITAPSISYTFLCQGWLVVMLALYRDSVLSLLTLIAQPFLEQSSQVRWDRWDGPDFLPSPLLRGQTGRSQCCLFSWVGRSEA